MIKNFLLVSLRSFLQNKSYTFINVFGLAVAIASSSLIFKYVYDELNYDSIHPDYENTYGLGVAVVSRNGSEDTYGVVPGGWVARIKDKFPAVTKYTRLMFAGFPHSFHDKRKDRIVLNQDGDVYWVEETLRDVIQFSLLKGNEEKALSQANSMVVSESGAKILFGNEDPINQLITVKHPFATQGKEVEYVITGVFKDYPSNTFFRPKYLLNIHGLRPVYESAGINFDNYKDGIDISGGFFFSFFKANKGFEPASIINELNSLADFANRSDSAFYASGSRAVPYVQAMNRMHFDEHINWAIFDESANEKTLFILAAIGILILVIASINYMNLATARATSRAKEVGVRKTLGSSRGALIFQFLQESGITTILSLLVAIVLIVLLLPFFNQLTNRNYTFSSLLSPFFLLTLIAALVFVALLGGSYPSFYLTAFKPIEVLKGRVSGKRSDGFRKFLVTFQFAAAIMLTSITIVIVKQMELIQESKLASEGDQIVSIRYGSIAPNEKYPAFKNALLQNKDIPIVTVANHLPRHDYFGNMQNTVKFAEIDDKEYDFEQINGDFDFPKAYNLEVIAGRDFDVNIPSDSNTVLLNERAVAELHKSPAEIIGMMLEEKNSMQRSTVIGVVRDFPFQSAYHAVKPLIVSPRPNRFDRIVYVKIPQGNISEKIQFIETTWKQVIPGIGFDYWFVSDEFNRLYKKERRLSSLSKLFAALTLCISILGVYGLASYLAEQTTKEVGIRKAHGASVNQIVSFFLKIFLKIFLVALLIAVPTSWYLTGEWLSSFNYRIDRSPLIFVSGAMVLLAFMLATIIYEVLKAARANPIKALKHEQ